MNGEWQDVVIVPEGDFNVGGLNYDVPPKVMSAHEEVARRANVGELISYNKQYLPESKSYKITFTHRLVAA